MKLSELPPRQQLIVALIAKGLTNAEIGEEMHISAHTVHTHLTTIRLKLKVPSRLGVAVWYTKQTYEDWKDEVEDG